MIHTRLDRQKATKWSEDLQSLLDTDKLTINIQKISGRLSSTVTAAFDRIGRAYIKPFYAQVYDPRPSPSPSLRTAADWWIKILALEHPKEWVKPLAHGRQLITIWTDASGASRGLGAVVRIIKNDSIDWSYTDTTLPEAIWTQLLDRSDHQIAYQEFAAVALAFASWNLKDTMVVVHIDNNTVLHSILKGSAKINQELNIAIGKMWLDCAKNNMALHFLRVESKANVADDPSRGRFDILVDLGAKRVEPILPEWFGQVWSLDV